MQERLDAIWKRFCMLYPKLDKFQQPTVVFNNRLKATAGRCYYDDNIIELSTSLYKKYELEFWIDTIPHEFAHQVTHNIFGNTKQHHGPEWKSVMLAYGIEPRTYHNYEYK